MVVAVGHSDAFKQAGTALEVEDHPMLVEFMSRGGGRPGQKSDRRHLTGRIHMYLVEHQPTTDSGVRSTCHTNVTSLNVNGAGSSLGPCVNLMRMCRSRMRYHRSLNAFCRFPSPSRCGQKNPGMVYMREYYYPHTSSSFGLGLVG